MTTSDSSDDYLAWFLGPKSENAQILEDHILLALRDYIHWRRNYFPGDKILVTQTAQRDLAAEHDLLAQNVVDMMAGLRRNFPFYSPRYIAHQLSDTTLPGVIGYFAGMLFNANNVTPEAAPVTVEWEIQACSRILAMLGFAPPPSPPRSRSERSDYLRRIEAGFGWAHITHGGTTANIESLWFARTVRYAPLAIQEIARKYDLPILVPRRVGPNTPIDATPLAPVATDIRTLQEQELFLLAPNEAIFLLSTYLKVAGTHLRKTGKEAIKLLDESPFSASNGIGPALARFPPVIFVSGAKHYSVTKAAHLLGVGRNSISVVRLDSSFRMDVDDLEKKLRRAVRDGRVPLAVVAIAGTTEEGAVDPIDRIVDLRDRLEREQVASFWLHIDAAWGGYLRSLFRWSDSVIGNLARSFGIDPTVGLPTFHRQLILRVRGILEARDAEVERLDADLDEYATKLELAAISSDALEYVEHLKFLDDAPWCDILPIRKLDARATREFASRHAEFDGIWVASHPKLQRLSDVLRLEARLDALRWHLRAIERLRRVLKERRGSTQLEALLRHHEQRLGQCVDDRDQDAYANELRDFFGKTRWTQALGLAPSQFKVTALNRLETVQSYVNDQIDLGYKAFSVQWPFRNDVGNAFMAFPYADSITVDPHKLGYVPYPCGVVAFRNDRVRHFVLEDAPYISSARQPFDAHQPPRHVSVDYLLEEATEASRRNADDPGVEVDAFAPFILEGSRPGAAATALWLSTQTVPLTMRGHGSILRASLLAARELYEWMVRWDRVLMYRGLDAHYKLVPLTSTPPDTNIVTFVVRRDGSRTLAEMNALTESVYSRFSIQAELGEREYSYSQPYFLSHTALHAPDYDFETVKALLARCESAEPRRAYAKHGVTVLRATVMNPYIHAMRSLGVGDVIKDFMRELGDAAEMAVNSP
jgi:glutamate/tyrosine decarboxylase-like PLP-dependent enzyme